MERRQTRQILRNIREEITRNQQVVQALVSYHDTVVNNIVAVMTNDSLANTLVSKTGFDFFQMAPQGIIRGNINSTSWEIARNSNIAIRSNYKTTALLTEVYAQQTSVKDVAAALLAVYNSREVHKKENLRETLILLKNHFDELKGLESGLLFYYEKALKELEQD